MQNSYTTVSSLRMMIGNLFNPDDVVPYTNQALERVINSGLWNGSIGYTAFESVDNFFTLPYQFLSVVGAQWFRCPVPVFGQFHDFVQGGPGQPIEGLTPEGIVEDLGDGYPTTAAVPTDGSVLKVTLTNASDAGKTIRFYGVSTGDLQVFDTDGVAGEEMTLTFPTTTGTTVFNSVTGIQVQTNSDGSSAMIGGWTLSSVAPDATVTVLGYYYPNETTPNYRRYRIGVTSNSNTTVPFAVTVLVRRRWIPVFKETDWVIPGNIGALKFAMQAIDAEASRNDAQDLWNQCYTILNQELHAVRGAVRPEMNYEVLGSLGGFGNVY